MPHIAFHRRVVLGLIGFGIPTAIGAQEPTGLQAAAALEKVVVEAIAKAEKSVVAIARVRRRTGDAPNLFEPDQLRPGEDDGLSPDFVPQEYGTGVVVDRQGLILTNYHVLGTPEQNTYYVWIQHRPFKVEKIKAADPWFDLAVLQIKADDLEPITFGDGSSAKKGQFVVALGNPSGIARDGQVSATWGILSNVSRRAPKNSGKPSVHRNGTLLQTDARLEHGTSGGALVNLRGEMIGLTTSLAARAGYEQSAGFAIPVDDDFKRVVETLKSGRKPEYGFLGIKPYDLDADSRQKRRFGAVVYDQPLRGTPADLARLKANEVITHVNGTVIYDHLDLMRELNKRSVGDRVELTVLSSPADPPSKAVKKTAVLGKRYLEGAIAETPDPIWRGLRVDYATALPNYLMGDRFQLPVDTSKCVAIVDVQPNTPAWKAGLRPGTFVERISGTPVSTPQQFYAAVDDKPGPVTVQLVGQLRGGAQTIVVEP